jgi:hypothetical protein
MTPCRALLPLLAILMFPGTGGLRAQTRLGVAFYDTDHLYDTMPALFYNDEKYTPDGELHWTAARYDRKIAAIASVIDSLGMPLVGLAGVENEQVVRDLAARCTAPYCYLHRTLNTLDGLDLALLYYGDLFVPGRIETGWGYLLVEGELAGRPVAIVLSRQSRFVPGLLEELRERRPGVPLLAMGRTETVAPARFGLRDALRLAERVGRGNVRSRSGWRMRDRILIDTALQVAGGDVYARRRLFDERTGSPLPTYRRTRYVGGAGYALPVFAYLE